jgi:hypothetical protein
MTQNIATSLGSDISWSDVILWSWSCFTKLRYFHRTIP